MEKVSLYVKKILALALSTIVFGLTVQQGFASTPFLFVLFLSASLLLFAYLDFRITDEKPRFLFGLNQSDTFLNQKGGFWNLFKWIVTLFGFLYDMVIWTIWGVFLIFMLFADLLLFIKEILFWIIHAVIWFVRQLFPPFIFMFKMILHYLINWVWWIYQVTVNNMKTCINKNFYFIALWGTIPALFIVFLFYAISQVVGIPGLVAISVVFALIPLVWSYGEIAALRFEKRQDEDYSSVQYAFKNGFEAVRSVLVYLIAIIILLIAEIVFNLLGWIPNLSMSLLGITLNLNMAISFVLVFLAIIISFAGAMLPTHLLYHPEHNGNLGSSLGFLRVIGRKFPRYLFAELPAGFFGSLLLIIPLAVMLLTYQITDTIKDNVIDVRIEQLSSNGGEMESMDAYRNNIRIDRLSLYKDMPLLAPARFTELANSVNKLDQKTRQLADAREDIKSRKADFDSEFSALTNAIEQAKSGRNDGEITRLSSNRLQVEENYLKWESLQKKEISYLSEDIKELKRKRVQMPILYFFVGILFSVFGGIVLAVYVMYMGNIYFELYSLREDDEPSYWVETLDDIRKKDSNQPLLGFTFLFLIGVGLWLYFWLM